MRNVKYRWVYDALIKQDLTIERWAKNNGYNVQRVYDALSRWGNRKSSHPIGKTYDILVALSLQVGKPVSPVLYHEVKSLIAEQSQNQNLNTD